MQHFEAASEPVHTIEAFPAPPLPPSSPSLSLPLHVSLSSQDNEPPWNCLSARRWPRRQRFLVQWVSFILKPVREIQR